MTVFFDDWLYRQDDKHVFNLTSIRKFGLEFGRLTLFFQKQ
ncbi:putative lipoprotein precursor [Vibrio ishigakensis]|uniref:Putative lipoprotein n=1 Tax=Vibrio ishigakensis TaxID=1481914 RepID=A0A0B8PES8_9VIBR|nr:putative lipoprotein precursor [Vibrio ishigakensis]